MIIFVAVEVEFVSWKRPNVLGRLAPLIDIIHETDGVWIDVGSGEGTFSLILQKKSPNLSIYQLDRLNYRDFGASRNFNLILSDIKQIPVRFKALSGFICSQVLHYFNYEDQEKILKLLLSKLELNGKLVIIEYEEKKSYSWLPYPVPLTHLIQVVKDQVDMMIINHISIPDFGRPKYSLVLGRTGTSY